mmetsp:Transcript_33756/g.85431  ORF Transcript_33756/g.85431 Transcript_33756/m.85431 type:complete len:539 (-) Transcript_33756:1450-3066(-)
MQQSQSTATTASPQAPPASPSGQAQPRFQIVKPLGTGGQGFVQLVLDTVTGQHCAVKYIDRGWSRSFYKYVSREILNHASLSLRKHPHIVEFLEVFLTPRYLGVVMEYVNGTNLQQYLEANGGRLDEDVARFIFQQLMIAVDFCHKNGKVNRDIKLANVLLQLNGNQLPLVKLCDFGFSKDKFDDSEPQTQIGTALFTAPEIFTNTQGQIYDAEAADVWSCGVVLYVMLCGGHPFLGFEDCRMKKHAQVMKLIENSVNGRLMWPEGSSPSPLAVDLIRHVLVSKPNERYKISDILQHPWFLEKLPPGALVLNDAYLSMKISPSEARQTPEAIKQIVRAAVSVNSTEGMDRQGLGTSSAATASGMGTTGGGMGGGGNGTTPGQEEQGLGYSEIAASGISAAPNAAYTQHTAQSALKPMHPMQQQQQPHLRPHMPMQAQAAPPGQMWGQQGMVRPPMGMGGMQQQGGAAAGIATLAQDSGQVQAELNRLMHEANSAMGGQPGIASQPPMGMDPPLAMNVGANVLLDSSILMDMNLPSLEH